MDIKTLALIPFGIILFSLLFFSRGILIFLTILCLELVVFPYAGIGNIALQLRWIFFILFSLHTFGDIFLGRTVRSIKSFDILALFFIIYSFFSAFYSPFPVLTLERSATILILYLCVFWIIWKYAYDRSPERVAQIILNAMWVVFILSYLMIFIGSQRPFLAGRFSGIFGNPNGMGIISAIILPLSLWHFLETKKISSFLLFFMIFLALLLSAARGSLNAAAFALGYFLYARSKKNKPLVFFSSMSLFFMFIWIIETLGKAFFKVYIRAETISILGGRLEIWPVALNLILDKPMFGYGFGVEDKIVALKKIILLKHAGAYIHNSYLGILLQLGVLGFILLFIPLFTLLFKEVFSKGGNESTSLLRYALRSSLIAGMVCCIYESWIYSVGNAQALPFWIIVMLLAFYRHNDNKNIPDGIGT